VKDKSTRNLRQTRLLLHITGDTKSSADRPVKVFEGVEDATIRDETKVKGHDKTLVNGKWKTSVKMTVKRRARI